MLTRVVRARGITSSPFSPPSPPSSFLEQVLPGLQAARTAGKHCRAPTTAAKPRIVHIGPGWPASLFLPLAAVNVASPPVSDLPRRLFESGTLSSGDRNAAGRCGFPLLASAFWFAMLAGRGRPVGGRAVDDSKGVGTRFDPVDPRMAMFCSSGRTCPSRGSQKSRHGPRNREGQTR